LPEAVTLLRMPEREERIGPRNPEELAGFRGAAGGSASGLAQHEIGSRLVTIQAGDGGNDVVVAVHDQQGISRLEISSIHASGDIIHSYNSSPVLGVAGVIKVQVAGTALGDVLEIGVPRRDRAIYSRLIVRIKAKSLGKAAVLGRVNLSARHQRNKVVLHRRRIVLLRKCGRGFACAGQPDYQTDAIAVAHGYDFAARVKSQPASVIDDLVPHAQPTLFGLAKVIAVEYPGDALFEIYRNQSIRWVARHGK